ncbi:conserved protein of unknown function [Candidatus Filomicrobium marinum]|uniref:Protein YebE n=1 Tax=Candidatus Filomicrobium marinum TaxID=1608628 RepID=A0A0D6JKB2_9HYPH|nr:MULTISPECIES: DUF533 domain-containing protein [Filomicrobium]MCV0369166.1 DUF533 domain-containing protein [Filomicrobium sp.]CFX60074.1 conserved protein of unknown function [Candidatus Filomicrobium marinum]CPR22398.1 conserved protein of unknown function [Candidatus Filomicrobium marinum]
MFDAKSLLDALVGGAKPAHTSGAPDTTAHGDPLGDLLRNIIPDKNSENAGAAAPPSSSGDDIGDILNNLKEKIGAEGGLGDILGQVFGQATSGVREGAGKIDEATGASDSVGDAVRQLSGKSPEELIATVREMIANNQLGAGAALGGLGALILGTQTGRSVAVGAAKIGALALIGGLAYKAYQNYQQGRPLITGKDEVVAEPPPGSGFEPSAVSNREALTLIRTMVAAAAADGRVDSIEQNAILGSLPQHGLNGEAEEFLAAQLNHPASIDEIAGAIRSKEEAVRVYTAARITIEPDSDAEKDFLASLASRLNIEPELAAHLNASARQVGA